MGNIFKYGDIIYHDLQSLNRKEMANYAIADPAWVGAITSLQMVPITAPEFKHICTFLPIVFSPVGIPMPIAIFSFSPDTNPFVKNGQWRQNTYLPMAITRYPFALADTKNSDNSKVMCIDASASDENHPIKLFNEHGENNPVLDQAIQRCKEYDSHLNTTKHAIEAIEAAGLFIEKQLTITDAEGNKKKTGPFKVVDAEKYASLSDENIVKLQKVQALWMIHAHLLSMDRIVDITKMSQP